MTKPSPQPKSHNHKPVQYLLRLLCFLCHMLTDLAALMTAIVLAHFVRSQVLTRFIHFDQAPLSLESQIRAIFPLGALVIIIIFSFQKLYTRRFTFWQEARHLFRGTTLAFVLIMTTIFISRRFTDFSRVVVILAGIFSLALFPLFRLAVKKLMRKIHLWEKRVIILGTGDTALLVAEGIRKNPTLGYEIVGFLGDLPEETGRVVFGRLKVLGKISQIAEMMPRHNIQDIIIALPSARTSDLVELIEKAEKFAETIRIIPGLGSLFTMGVEVEDLGDILSLSVARNLTKPWNTAIKRSVEFLIALFLFIILIPFYLVIAVAIKLDSPGSVLFTQERLGMRHRAFRLFKFRSMYLDGDARLRPYLEQNPEARMEWETFQKLKNGDPRVTRAGRFIRKYSLDELPQLLNVLRGDMGLVGPRPYLPREIEEMGDSYHIISQVKPGLTGLWQVSGRNALPFDERLFLDEYYIRNWSIWLDIIILFKTIKVLIRREGAY